MPEKYYTYTTTLETPKTFDPPKRKKKLSKIKLLLFYIKWHWDNRKWEDCRHKRRAYKRAWLKQFRKDGVRNDRA